MSYPKLACMRSPQLAGSDVILKHNKKCNIGRSPGSTHVLDSIDMSRTHCTIYSDSKANSIINKWYIIDVSANGTNVNTKKLEKNALHELKHGDIVKLSNSYMYKFMLYDDSNLLDVNKAEMLQFADDLAQHKPGPSNEVNTRPGPSNKINTRPGPLNEINTRTRPSNLIMVEANVMNKAKKASNPSMMDVNEADMLQFADDLTQHKPGPINEINTRPGPSNEIYTRPGPLNEIMVEANVMNKAKKASNPSTMDVNEADMLQFADDLAQHNPGPSNEVNTRQGPSNKIYTRPGPLNEIMVEANVMNKAKKASNPSMMDVNKAEMLQFADDLAQHKPGPINEINTRPGPSNEIFTRPGPLNEIMVEANVMNKEKKTSNPNMMDVNEAEMLEFADDLAQHNPGPLNLFNIVAEEVTCSICTELLIKSCALNCGHCFCKYCIEQWRKHKKVCPICRTTITTQQPQRILDNIINKLVDNMSLEDSTRRGMQIQERDKENKKKLAKENRRFQPIRQAARRNHRRFHYFHDYVIDSDETD